MLYSTQRIVKNITDFPFFFIFFKLGVDFVILFSHMHPTFIKVTICYLSWYYTLH